MSNHAAHAIGEDGTAAEEAAVTKVRLNSKVGRTTVVLPWDFLARTQPPITKEVLSSATPGQAFALEDKNVMSEPWRKIIIVRDSASESFAVFDQQGRLIVEPQDGLKNGRQSVSELLEEFAEEGYYYRPPTLRSSPSMRRRAVFNSPDKEPRLGSARKSASSPTISSPEAAGRSDEVVEAHEGNGARDSNTRSGM